MDLLNMADADLKKLFWEIDAAKKKAVEKVRPYREKLESIMAKKAPLDEEERKVRSMIQKIQTEDIGPECTKMAKVAALLRNKVGQPIGVD